MRAGDFEAAWRVSDRVLRARDPAGRDDPALPYHLRWVWDGRPLDGADALVRCYHGLGDTLQFARYLAPLRRRVRRLTLEAPPALLPLLGTLAGPDRIVPFRPDRPLPPSGCDLEIMELAHALRMEPDPAPFLRVAPLRPADERLQVGLCLRSNSDWDPERGVPEDLLPRLLEVPGAAFHSLQPGLSVCGTECPDTLLDTARLLAGLDLVISADTMVAHLAGALGKELLLLLKAVPDWRWLAGGTGSVWYRDVRKYRQRRPGDWDAPTRALVADLTGLAARHSLSAGRRLQEGL